MQMNSQNEDRQVGFEEHTGRIEKYDATAIFSGDAYGLFIFKKTEKIVSAIYLLTGLMPESEPMRNRLREIATDMLATALSMSDRVWGEETFQKNITADLSEMLVLFGVAETARMISPMNCRIIVDELRKLLKFLAESSSNYSSAKIAFPNAMFDGDYSFAPENAYQPKTAPAAPASPAPAAPIVQGQDMIKDTEKKVFAARVSDIKTEKPEKVIKDKDNRQDVILSMLKGGAKLTMSDFAKNIKGCSDKTIQRELIALVSKGVLKKEGERRWSKYFLA